jgi:hypothetical protein
VVIPITLSIDPLDGIGDQVSGILVLFSLRDHDRAKLIHSLMTRDQHDSTAKFVVDDALAPFLVKICFLAVRELLVQEELYVFTSLLAKLIDLRVSLLVALFVVSETI